MICHAKKFLLTGFVAGWSWFAASAQPVLPLYFEANHGPAENSASFIAHQRDSQFLITSTGAEIGLHPVGGKLATMRMSFGGANPQAQIFGAAELSGKVNYLVGSDPAHWRASVPTFAKVRVTEIYPGINVIYYGNQQQLEYDFNVAPGANPDAIKIQFAGTEKISVGDQGELILTLPGGEIRQPQPVIYQVVAGVRHEITGGYKILDAHTVAFTMGSYDHRLPLVIDPVLSYSTYFGGNSGETPWAVALDTNGFIYLAGQTFSTKFTNNVPFSFSTPGAYQTNYHGGGQAGDAFVAKFDNAGTNLIYLTYLGGSGNDAAYGLAVDKAGHAFVTGATDSTNFPVKNAVGNGTNIGGPIDPHVGAYPSDAFVTELETNGASLVYSTYLGGESSEAAYSIAVDSLDNAYVTGFTYSTNFPTSTNALFRHLRCFYSFYLNANAFVTEIASNGTTLVYSSYLGGSNYDQGRAIAVDISNFVYVAGFTASTNFPVTNGLFGFTHLNNSTNLTFAYDAFVSKFTPGCTNLVYSTYLGEANPDIASSIACDAAGNAFVTGQTTSPHFPNSTSPLLPNGLNNNLSYAYVVTTNAFLTEITNGILIATTNSVTVVTSNSVTVSITNAVTFTNNAFTGIAHSAVFGGTNLDVATGVAVGQFGNIFVVGYATSTNFPTTNTVGFLRANNSGRSDVFVTCINSNFTGVIYSGLLGGTNDDFGYGIAVDSSGSAYIVGQTSSTNFPTFAARQTARNGTNDGFLAKILLFPSPPTMTARLSGTNFLVSWLPVGQETPEQFKLETTLRLNPSPVFWQVVTQQVPVFTNGVYTFTFGHSNLQSYFRLHKF